MATNGAKAEIGRAPTKALPVTLLSGFLGSGKTTLLQHILHSDHGLRIAVIVNDVGAVNIDAAVIRNSKTLAGTGEKVIALQNGCICCSLRSDLLEELVRLADLADFDYIIIEGSGISEPGQIAETFDARLIDGISAMKDDGEGLDEDTLAMLKRIMSVGGVDQFARLDTVCTVIDAFTILQDFETLDMLSTRRNDVTPKDERAVSDLMVDQIEFADVIVLNKSDLVNRRLMKRVRKLIVKLNHRAKILECAYGKIDVKAILNTGLFSMETAQTGAGWLQDLHALTLAKIGGKNKVITPNEAEEYDIRNFCYVRHRPFHPRRLYELIYAKFILQHDEVEEDETESGDGDAMEDEMEVDDEEDDDDDEDMEDAPQLPDDDRVLVNKRTDPLFSRLFRSKGEFWLATRPNRAGEWSQAGVMLTMTGGRPWFITTERSEWETGDAQIDAMVESDIAAGGEFGDRRQELVFIGEDLDIPELKKVFDKCLLTDEEWQKWKDVMLKGEDPNKCSREGYQTKVEQLAQLFEDGFPEWLTTADHDHDHEHHDGHDGHDHSQDHGHKHGRRKLH